MALAVFTTNKGTELYWEISYDLGGSDFFGGNIPRGYSLFVRRQRGHFTVSHGLDKDDGAGRQQLLAVSRKSKKQEALAIEKAKEALPKIAALYDL